MNEPATEREIFGPHPVGGFQRFWDPLRIYRRLVHATGGQLAKVWTEARLQGPADIEGDSEEVLQDKARARQQADLRSFPAMDRLLAATAFAFEVTVFDPTSAKGLTEQELEDLLETYFVWCDKKKVNTASSATSPAPTVLPVSSAAAPPAMTSKSDCGCS